MMSRKVDTPRSNIGWFHYRPDASTVFVFVHGLFSDASACWKNGENFWPELVRSDARLGGPGIFLAQYHTGMLSGDYSIADCAREVLRDLRQVGLQAERSVVTHSNIVFVCHSMGGIVVRYMLEANFADFSENAIGLVLMGSPSVGSDYADHVGPIAALLRQKQIAQLRPNSDVLGDLDERFRDLVDRHKLLRLAGAEAVEGKGLGGSLIGLFLRRIVARDSAGRYFGAPITIPGTGHGSIVKPTSLEHGSHRFLVDFFTQKFSRVAINGASVTTPNTSQASWQPENEGRLMPEAWTSPVDGTVMIRIPSCEVWLGNSLHRLAELNYRANTEAPPEWDQHRVQLSEFWIARTPVTNRQYLRFCEETGRKRPDRIENSLFSGSDSPVIGVSWIDALAYAKWVGLTLPTEAQWERVAAGTEARLFPWGNREPISEEANCMRIRQGTCSVNLHPKGVSEDCLLGLAGNVLEWCLDDTRDYASASVVDPIGTTTGCFACIRGGSFTRNPNECRSSYRERRPKSDAWGSTGFRLAFNGERTQAE